MNMAQEGGCTPVPVMPTGGSHWASAAGAAIAVAVLVVAACCWFVVVPFCFEHLHVLLAIPLAGLAGAWGAVLVVIAVIALRHAFTERRRDGE